MLTSPLLQFSHNIKAGGRLREFNFLRRAKSDLVFFHVDVPDEKGNRVVFDMQERGGAWRIASAQIPEWVPQAENSLEAAIKEHLV
jgi:hypothetical protein